MTYRLCVCLTEKTSIDCIDYVTNSDADLIEHRLDFMNPIESLKEIYSATEIPIIATCRSQSNGGVFRGPESQRIQHLTNAIDQGVSYVDIEFETDRRYTERVLDIASRNHCKVILSKHFTQVTPNSSTLVNLAEIMTEEGPDVLKIVVTPKSIEDCRSVLQLYSIDGLETPLIAFAMGGMGRFTRVSALFLGAPFMYVSQDSGDAAAPGQISLSDMRTIVRCLS